jgi:ethanolaminephosphotransferase
VDCPAIATVVTAKAAFFYLGNSNSLATINVGAGYIGVGTYWPAIVTALLAVHTYTGPLLVYAHYAAYNGYRGHRRDAPGEAAAALVETYFYLAAGQLAVMSVLCTVLRFHLFVWTVFSPKLLYLGMELIVTTTFLVVYTFLDSG